MKRAYRRSMRGGSAAARPGLPSARRNCVSCSSSINTSLTMCSLHMKHDEDVFFYSGFAYGLAVNRSINDGIRRFERNGPRVSLYFEWCLWISAKTARSTLGR